MLSIPFVPGGADLILISTAHKGEKSWTLLTPLAIHAIVWTAKPLRRLPHPHVHRDRVFVDDDFNRFDARQRLHHQFQRQHLVHDVVAALFDGGAELGAVGDDADFDAI